MTHAHDAAFWDTMYRNRQAPWDPEPNALVAETAATLTPGDALDVGCGEGADALWLAARGWRVTAMDVSGAALERARAADTEHRVTWHQADMHAWEPATAAFDLVTAYYLHIPPAERAAFFGMLARAVRPGGMLLVATHHPSDLQTGIGRPAQDELFCTPDEIASYLPADAWSFIECGTRPHVAHNGHGHAVHVQDTVVIARRVAP